MSRGAPQYIPNLEPLRPSSCGLGPDPGAGREVTSLSFETLGQEERRGEASELGIYDLLGREQGRDKEPSRFVSFQSPLLSRGL